MNILVVCQYYTPEPFRIHDVCEELVARGHEVTVVTGTPNYPMGEVYPGYEDGKRADEVIGGVKVHRVKCAPRKTGTLNRLRNYFSFASASKKYIKKLGGQFDVVFVNQLSPVMMAEAGIAYKKKHGKRMVLYCLDLWPESLCVGGVKSSSLIYKIFRVISKKIYRAADEILITSRSFRSYLKDNFNIEDGKMRYLPQYAEAQFLSLAPKKQEGKFHLLFAGNLGTAQSLDTVVEAARILKGEDVVFDLVGDGKEMERLQVLASDLPSVVFHGRKPIEEMPTFYAQADATLLTLVNDSFISQTLPGKAQSYMAAGKPIVGAICGEAALVLQEAQGGYCGEAENAEQLAQNILALKNSDCAAQLGAGNRAYYLQHFSKEKFMDGLIARLEGKEG